MDPVTLQTVEPCRVIKRREKFTGKLLGEGPFSRFTEGSAHLGIGGLVIGFADSIVEFVKKSAGFNRLGGRGLGGRLGGWHCVGGSRLVWVWRFSQYPNSGSNDLIGLLKSGGALGSEKSRMGIANVRCWACRKR